MIPNHKQVSYGCRALDATHAWDDGAVRGDGASDVIGEWLCGSIARFNGAMPVHRHLSSGHRPDGEFTQKLMMAVFNKTRRDAMVAAAGIWDKARLEATSAPHAGSAPEALPSVALDTQLTNAEVQYGVGRRLGVEICEQSPCPFCLGVMDKWGAHCESCIT